MVEQLPCKQQVVGSIPATYFKTAWIPGKNNQNENKHISRSTQTRNKTLT